MPPFYLTASLKTDFKLLDAVFVIESFVPNPYSLSNESKSDIALLNVASHETIRAFITEHARVRSVRYLGEVFHAVQCPSVILTLEKTSFSNASGDVIVNVGDSNYIVRRQRKGADFNFKVTDQEALVLDKMDDLEHCVKLKTACKNWKHIILLKFI